MRYRYLLVPLLALGLPAPAFGQDAGALLRERQRSEEVRIPESLPEPEAMQPDAAPLDAAEDEQTILIRSVRFTGQASLLSDAERAALAVRIEGTEATFRSIRALADATNTALRQNGRLLAQANIPPQDATDGTLIVEIAEGSLAEIAFEYGEGVRVDREVLSGIAVRHVDRQSLTKQDLESALLRMNDLPGVFVQSRLAPGETAGTSRLVVNVSEERAVSGALHGDNFGSPSTGRAQGHAQLFFSNLTGIGELTQLGFSYSEGQRYGSLAFSAPLSASGIGMSATYGYLSYENIDPIGEAAGLEGRAHYGSVGLHYQAIRSRAGNLRLSATLNGKALTDDSTAGRLADKRIVSGTLDVSGDVTDTVLEGGVTQLTLAWTFGDLDLSRLPVAELLDSIGLQTEGGFHRVNADLIRLQRLPDGLSLLARLSGQWASKNLDSSESFSLGGPYGVRGWPVGEARGDMGIAGTLELRYDLPVADGLGGLRLSAFLDGGRAWLNKRTFGIPSINACGCNAYSLASAGLGLSWQHKHFNAAVGWAHGLSDNPGRAALTGANVDGKTGRQQFWLSGSFRF